MTLDRAIASGRERRRRYFGAKAVDASCRPHGGCPWCEGSRMIGQKRADEDAKDE